MSVVLIGPPGAGKSTVGALLAERLGVPFTDTDAAVESEAGRPISDIFVQDGEAAFRVLERQVVVRALGEDPGVLSLGGGAVMQPEVAEALRDARHRVVFLDVTIADAASRVGFDTSRPLLLVNPRAAWTRLMTLRRPTYEALAALTVPTGSRAPEDVVDEVLAGLREHR
ncbi:shikimate kinase [Ornithinimicrobium cerasi]|uniref:Shikimate kinase n=1 Tax=Ornithinimicrobium cerasi TaxID=2248773 RepID=A0A285VN33_9MICO|nr:shikimate kinase [Ornithinimicrobium cerasi]SOC54626.1 shikimate kinase [Ornithinimicrobium cerasi]